MEAEKEKASEDYMKEYRIGMTLARLPAGHGELGLHLEWQRPVHSGMNLPTAMTNTLPLRHIPITSTPLSTLDKWLPLVPDEPPIPGYTSTAPNILLNQGAELPGSSGARL
ncbi:hypothetical protein O3P69_007036 [Scylla paramamosain]|uniref:Uncharacterized protein n=1 Tax=Scylla paramamosain TaxID=85552 RepID=A0AAW0V2G0_SCYPA